MVNQTNIFGQELISTITDTLEALKPEILEFDDEGFIIDDEQ